MFGAMRLGIYAANPIGPTGVTGGYALFGGGYDNTTIDAGTRTAVIRKYNLPTDAVSTITATLSAQLDQVGGFANGTTGIFAGGSNGNSTSYTRRIALADESATTGQALNTNTLATRYCRCGSSATAGFMYGGWTTAQVNDVKKYTYSSDVWGYATNTLGYATALASIGVHSDSTRSMLSGGFIIATTAPQNIIKSYTFSDESATTVGYTLAETRAQHCVTGNQTHWVSLSGFNNSSAALTLSVESYAFSDGTQTSASALSYGFRLGDAAGDDSRGIFSGGINTGGGTYSTTANKIYTYSSNTHASAGAYLYTAGIDIPGALHSLQTS